MLLKKKFRPSSTAINNTKRPLRPYQKKVIVELEDARKTQHQTSKIAVLYLDSPTGTGKDDIMKYFGEYTGIPGAIMVLAPEIAMIEKVQEQWHKKFDPFFVHPRKTHTSTIQGLYWLCKKVLNDDTLSKKQQELYDNLIECGTLCFNEVHKLATNDDLVYIPTILKALEKINLPYTVVNVSAVIEDINEKAWGVPFEIGLCQTKDTDEWLNPTEVHTHACGMSVTWEKVAMQTDGLDFNKLDKEEQQSLSNAHNTISQNLIYDDSDTADEDIKSKKELNKKLQQMHPTLGNSVRIFTNNSIHALKLATIDDIVNVYFSNNPNSTVRCIWYTFSNRDNFSYVDYLVDRINEKTGKNSATAYNSDMDKQSLKEIRNDFENNKGAFDHVVCKSMLVEDFDKLDLLHIVNAHPVRDPKSSGRTQKYGRVRRPILTDPLDSGTNVKAMSHIWQATNVKQISDAGNRFKKHTIDIEILKKIYPTANLNDPKIVELLSNLLAIGAETKIQVNDRNNDPFQDHDLDFIPKDANPLDVVLGGLTYQEALERLGEVHTTPPGVTISLHKITDVQAGHSVSLGKKSYVDIFKVERFTTEQYQQWMRNRLVIL